MGIMGFFPIFLFFFYGVFGDMMDAMQEEMEMEMAFRVQGLITSGLSSVGMDCLLLLP